MEGREAWEVYVGNVECESGGEMQDLAGVKRGM